MEISQATNYPKNQSTFALLPSLQVLKELIVTCQSFLQILSIILRYTTYSVANLVATAQEFEKAA